MKLGKEYELLIEQLYRQLEPNAIIVQDDSIFGRNTNSMRQIDVSIRYKFLGLDNLVIVQAKDYKRPADINRVGEFLSVIEDVSANKGILICSKGFSRKAIEYAKNKGVELLTVHSANNKKWETLLKVKVRKTVHNFDIDHDLIMDVRDYSGKNVIFDSDAFSYDGRTIVQLLDIIHMEILQKHTWKEIKRQNWIRVDLTKLNLSHVFNETLIPIYKGYVSIRYKSTIIKEFCIDPANYIYEVNHVKQENTIHNLSITIDDLENIETINYPHDMTVEGLADIESVIYNFDVMSYATHKFQHKGYIIGPAIVKGDQISKDNDRVRRIAELEKILRYQKRE